MWSRRCAADTTRAAVPNRDTLSLVDCRPTLLSSAIEHYVTVPLLRPVHATLRFSAGASYTASASYSSVGICVVKIIYMTVHSSRADFLFQESCQTLVKPCDSIFLNELSLIHI